MSAKILAIGNAYFEIDSLHFPIDKVAINREVSGSNYELYPGGSAINFVRICKQLGFTTFFIGKTGKDLTGEAVKKMLQDEEINFYPIISPDHQTNLAINFVGDQGDQYLFVSGTAATSLEAHELEEKMKEILPQVEYLYLGGIFKFKKLIPSLEEIVHFVHAQNKKVILDHNRITNAVTDEEKEIMRRVVPLVDYYFPSKDELIDLYKVSSFEEAINLLIKEREGVTVIKDAENGAIGIKDSQTIKVPAFKVEVHNTVGAGDSFNAGFMRAVSDGMQFEDSVRFACATAALKISKKELPTYDDVVKMLNS